MNMIGHQHIGVQITLMLLAGLSKLAQVKLIVLIRVKNGFTVIAPNNYMLGLAGQVKAG